MGGDKAAIYVLRSPNIKSFDKQIDDCQEYCRNHKWDYDIFAEGLDQVRESRLELDRMLKRVRSGEYRSIVVWQIKTLGKSIKHMLQVVSELRNRNVEIVMVKHNISTISVEAQPFLELLDEIYELHHEFTSEAVKASLATKKRKGIRVGRPPGAKDTKPRKKSGYINRWKKERNELAHKTKQSSLIDAGDSDRKT